MVLELKLNEPIEALGLSEPIEALELKIAEPTEALELKVIEQTTEPVGLRLAFCLFLESLIRMRREPPMQTQYCSSWRLTSLYLGQKRHHFIPNFVALTDPPTHTQYDW